MTNPFGPDCLALVSNIFRTFSRAHLEGQFAISVNPLLNGIHAAKDPVDTRGTSKTARITMSGIRNKAHVTESTAPWSFDGWICMHIS